VQLDVEIVQCLLRNSHQANCSYRDARPNRVDSLASAQDGRVGPWGKRRPLGIQFQPAMVCGYLMLEIISTAIIVELAAEESFPSGCSRLDLPRPEAFAP
jgi:hypothetical protein